MQLLLIKHGSLAEKAALLERVRGGDEIAKQFGIDVSSATMTAELHFAVGHFAVAAPQDFLQVEGDMPKVGRPAAEPMRVEREVTRAESPAGRRDAAMSKVVERDGVTQAGFGIFVQHAEQAV